MKFLLVLAVSLLVVVAAGIGVLLFRTPAATSMPDVRDRLDALSREVQDLRAEIAARKTGELSDSERAAILQLIVDDRADQQAQQRKDQQKRFLELSLACADRAAQKYGWTAEQRASFADVLLLGRDKLEEMETRLRDLGLTSDIDGMVKASEAAYRDFKAWRTEELTKRLGPDLARRVGEDADFNALANAGLVQASRASR